MQKQLKAAFDMLLSPDQNNALVAIELLESSLFTAEQVEAYAQEHFWWVMQGNWWDGESQRPKVPIFFRPFPRLAVGKMRF